MAAIRRPYELRVHLTDEERTTLTERSRGVGSPHLAGYVRAAALGQPVPVAATVPAANLEQFALLGRAAGNLNQIARHLNNGDILTDRDLMPVLRQLYEDVRTVQRLLVGETRP